MTPFWVIRERPTHKVVLEVDEYQHKKGEYNCEVKRMWDIAQALGIPLCLFATILIVIWLQMESQMIVLNNKGRTHKLLSCIRDAIHSQNCSFFGYLYIYDKSNIEIIRKTTNVFLLVIIHQK